MGAMYVYLQLGHRLLLNMRLPVQSVELEWRSTYHEVWTK